MCIRCTDSLFVGIPHSHWVEVAQLHLSLSRRSDGHLQLHPRHTAARAKSPPPPWTLTRRKNCLAFCDILRECAATVSGPEWLVIETPTPGLWEFRFSHTVRVQPCRPETADRRCAEVEPPPRLPMMRLHHVPLRRQAHRQRPTFRRGRSRTAGAARHPLGTACAPDAPSRINHRQRLAS